MKRFIILLCLIFAGLLTSPILTHAQVGGNAIEIDNLNEKIQARKDKIKELENSIEQQKKNIEQKQNEAVSLKNQLNILDNHSAQLELDIELVGSKINKAELEISALKLSIQDKEDVINRQKTIIKTIIQNLHAQDQKNYLEILLTNENFSDFFNQVKYLENIYTDLGRSVKSIRLAKEDLEDKKGQIEVRKKTYGNLKAELVNKQQDLEEQSGYKNSLLVRTKSSEARYQTLLANLRNQYQQIENEIRSYEAEVRKRLADSGKEIKGDTSDLIWPVPSHYITAYFHDKSYPYKHIFEHNAIDIRAGQGTPVKAALSGYVGTARYCTTASCYSYVLLIHNSGLSTVYGHLSRIAINVDEYVNQGDVIGYSGAIPGTVGAGPFTTGPHLHFETRVNGIPVNPLNYLTP